jgi:hypothetical protein
MLGSATGDSVSMQGASAAGERPAAPSSEAMSVSRALRTSTVKPRRRFEK